MNDTLLRAARRLAAIAALACLTPLAQAATVTVAVAANFKQAAGEIAKAFQAKTGDTVQYAFGATGNLAAQIRNGAPFDVLLSADDTTPPKLAAEGHADAASAFTYARGTLVLYSTTLPVHDNGEAVLRAGRFAHVAVANPKTAPYGAAAMSALARMGLTDAVTPKIVQGGNIGQTFDFVATGNAELGFVALSQAIGAGRGQWWTVPAADYAPINQGAILLAAGRSNAAARAYLDFLRGPEALAVIRKYGYAVGN